MDYIISQCILAVAYLILILSFLFNKKEKLLLFFLIDNILFLVGYIVFGAWEVVPTMIISIFRNILFYFLAKYKIHSYIFLILLELITFFACLYTWNGILSCIILFGYLAYTYGCWQNSKLVLLICNCILSVCFIVYNILISNIVPIVMESVVIVFSIVMYLISLKSLKINKKSDKCL